MAMGTLSGIKAGPPPDTATAVKILKSALDSGFDPTKSAALRNAEIGEHDTHIANLIGLHDPMSQDELQRQIYLKQSLQVDNQADPYTGLEAQSHTRQVGDAQRGAAIYNDPDVTRQREDTERLKRLLTGEPARVSGNAARDVADINAEGGVRKALATPGKTEIPRQIMNPQTGMVEWFAPGQAIHGQQAAGTGMERDNIKRGATTLDNIQDIIRSGDAVKWRGLGPLGGAAGTLYKYTGIGSNEAEDNLRTSMSKTTADIMFGDGGKNLTGTEKQIVGKYLADINTNPTVARSRLEKIYSMLENAQARKTGLPSTYEGDDQQQPGGGGGDIITNPNWGAR